VVITVETLFTCPLCGHQFKPDANRACSNCVLHKDCAMVCCPSCGYSTTDPRGSKLGRWISSGLDRKGKT
jgi:hypothetical protein